MDTVGDGDTDRRRHVDLADGEIERFGETGQDLPSDGKGTVGPGYPWAQDRELVTTATGDEIPASGDRFQPLGHLDQELIANAVPPRVVDGLETIEVQEENYQA